MDSSPAGAACGATWQRPRTAPRPPVAAPGQLAGLRDDARGHGVTGASGLGERTPSTASFDEARAEPRDATTCLAFVQGDLRTFSLGGRADLIASTTCLHWVADHEAVLRCCRAHVDRGAGSRSSWEGAETPSRSCPRPPRSPRPTRAGRRTSSRSRPHGASTRWLPRTGFRLVRAELRPKDMVHDGMEGLSGWIRTTWLPILGKLPEGLSLGTFGRCCAIGFAVESRVAQRLPTRAGLPT